MNASMKEIEKKVREHGICILSDPDGHAGKGRYTYSVGANTAGFPDFFMYGISAEHSSIIISNAWKILYNNIVPLEGPTAIKADAFNGNTVALTHVDQDKVREKFCTVANEYYGSKDYVVMQIVVTDPNGKFPWESDCDRQKLPEQRGYYVTPQSYKLFDLTQSSES